MAPTSPDKPDARRSRYRPPPYSISGSRRHRPLAMPRPSQSSSHCRFPKIEAPAESPAASRQDHRRRLSPSPRPVRKTRRPIVPWPRRSNAPIMAMIDRSLRSHPGVLGQSREPPAPADSKHNQSPCTPPSSIPSKRPHPVDGNNDSHCSHGSPPKRHCHVHQGLSELPHTATATTDLLPPFPSVDDVVTRCVDEFEVEFLREDQHHSSQSLASTKYDTTISPGKQRHDTTERRSTPARAIKEHNLLDQPTRPIKHQAKPPPEQPGYGRLPSETLDTKASQKLESPQPTAVGNTEGGSCGELPNPSKPSESKKLPRDASEPPKNPGPATAPVLEGWPLILVCIALLVGGMFFPDLRIPEFRAVDWNERAIELEIALATIPRVVLFGEASLSPQSLQPGMLPVDGLAHDHNPSFGPNVVAPLRSKWFSNSSDFPEYELWMTASDGVYVPELTLLDDLGTVTSGICSSLVFLPIPDGSSPSHEFCMLFGRALSRFAIFYMSEDRRLGFDYNEMSVGMNEVMLFNMEFLQEMQRNGSEELGSDQLRARALHAPTTITVPLSSAEPPSPRRFPADTSIPDDIPESFIKGWHDAMEARSSRVEQDHTPTSTAAIDTTASKMPKPLAYAEAQRNNGTADILVQHVLDVIVGRRLNLTNEAEGTTYGNIIEHSTKLDKLCDLLVQLNDHVAKAIRFANRTELRPVESRWLQRIEDAAPFLRDIAPPRLGGMQARARRGVQLLKETEKRQAELQNEIERTLRNGWLAPGVEWLPPGVIAWLPPGVEWLSHRIIYYYLPDLKSIALQWSHARQWLAVELEEVHEIHRGRQAEFRFRDVDPPNNLSKEQEFEWYGWNGRIIWSRWSLEDRRDDPAGKELFCWDLERRRPRVSIWQRMAGWVTGRDYDEFWSQCSDASRRHG